MCRHVRGFFIFYAFREVQGWIMNIELQLASYVCVNLPRVGGGGGGGGPDLPQSVAAIKFIATGHAGATQAMQDHRPSKINK